MASTKTAQNDTPPYLYALDLLRESDQSVRQNFDKKQLDELAQSIASSGVLVPLLVRHTGHNLEIVDGARRFRAAKLAKLKQVPCVVREGFSFEN